MVIFGWEIIKIAFLSFTWREWRRAMGRPFLVATCKSREKQGPAASSAAVAGFAPVGVGHEQGNLTSVCMIAPQGAYWQ